MTVTPQIEFEHVDKHYGAFHALKDISLRIEPGTFVALVGPSGCGKSTLLRTLAGLEKVTTGNIRIAGQEMTRIPPRQRDVAMVFQSYALYPHMRVAENLTYSLRLKGTDKEKARKQAEDVAGTTRLDGLLERFPRELSGGQRQRVAMGRAIIRQPKAFLFDEPLSNLDAALRVRMRKEIRALHDRLQATSVYVTHDQIEAMTMADIVVVLRDGVIEQEGRPLDLYDHPVNRFVAGFIGSPAMNFIDGTVARDGHSVTLDLFEGGTIEIEKKIEPGRRVVLGLRPEHMTIATDGAEGTSQLSAPVGVIESTGATTYVTTATDPELTVVHNGRIDLAAGDTIRLTIPPHLVHVFDQDTGQAI